MDGRKRGGNRSKRSPGYDYDDVDNKFNNPADYSWNLTELSQGSDQKITITNRTLLPHDEKQTEGHAHCDELWELLQLLQ